MEILVFWIQLLSLALVLFGAWLCAWLAYRDWAEADEPPRVAQAEGAPPASPAETDAEESTAA